MRYRCITLISFLEPLHLWNFASVQCFPVSNHFNACNNCYSSTCMYEKVILCKDDLDWEHRKFIHCVKQRAEPLNPVIHVSRKSRLGAGFDRTILDMRNVEFGVARARRLQPLGTLAEERKRKETERCGRSECEEVKRGVWVEQPTNVWTIPRLGFLYTHKTIILIDLDYCKTFEHLQHFHIDDSVLYP